MVLLVDGELHPDEDEEELGAGVEIVLVVEVVVELGRDIVSPEAVVHPL